MEMAHCRTIRMSDIHMFHDLINKACLVRDDGTIAFQALMVGRDRGFPFGRFEFNNVMNKLAKAANSRLARILWDTLFHEIPYFENPDDVTEVTRAYNNLVGAYANDGHAVKALEVVEQMKQHEIPRNVYTYNYLLNGNLEHSPAGQIELILKKMEEDGIEPDIVTFNTAISVASRCHNPREAFRAFDSMIKKNIAPDKFTFRSLFLSMSFMKHDVTDWLVKARRMWQVLQSHNGGERIDSRLVGAYVEMLSSNGQASLAYEIAVKWSTKAALTPYTWVSLLKSQRGERKLDEAKKFIKNLQATMSRDHAIPCIEFFNELIIVYSCHRNNERAFELAKSVLPDILTRGLLPTMSTYNSLIDACLPMKALDEAKGYFEKITTDLDLKPTVISYTSLIAVAVRCEDIEYAEKLFAEMKDANVRANEYTYRQMIRGYIQSNQLDKADALLNTVDAQNFRPFALVVTRMQLLLAKGEHDALFELGDSLLSKYNITPNYTCAHILLKSACVRKDRELALKLHSQMIEDGLRTVASDIALHLVGVLDDDWAACREWIDKLVESNCTISLTTFVAAVEILLRTPQLQTVEERGDALKYLSQFLRHQFSRQKVRDMVPEELKYAISNGHWREAPHSEHDVHCDKEAGDYDDQGEHGQYDESKREAFEVYDDAGENEAEFF